MNKNFLFAALVVIAVAATLAPASGFAYLAPEQVFGGQSLTLVPPTQREGAAVVAERQARAAEARAAEQSKLKPVDAAPVSVDTFVPNNSPQPLGLLDQNATYERRQERIQNERSSGPTIIIGGDATVTDGNGFVLHTGAPRVTSTGPESFLAFGLMLLAAVSTVAYSGFRSRRFAWTA